MIIVISIASIGVSFYIVTKMHKTRIQMLSLYANLHVLDVEEIIRENEKFSRELEEESEMIT
jgi:hypothetical protein